MSTTSVETRISMADSAIHMAPAVVNKSASNAPTRYKPLTPPDLLKWEFPQTGMSIRTVEKGRREAADIIHRRDDRLLVIVGPRSVHDLESLREYAKLIEQAATQMQRDLCLVMRCYVEEPQAARGWKGFINDPYLDGSFDINQGLRLARKLFVEITDMGVPLATEIVGALTPLYLAELLSIGAIGSSSLHSELASSMPCPVGFRSDSLDAAVDAMDAASIEHQYISVTPEGRTAIAWTRGNPNCFAIVERSLSSTALTHPIEKVAVMLDNSNAVREVCERVSAGEHAICGLTLESSLHKNDTRSKAKDGMDWAATMAALEELALSVRRRRNVSEN